MNTDKHRFKILCSVLGLGVIAILASWIPAVRAARLNPVQTLREEFKAKKN